VYYMTYEEVAATGLPLDKCFPPKLIAHGLTLDAALRMVDSLGFGHCAKPWNQ
jgi:hypothetical protein